jgi:hypothetical protein
MPAILGHEEADAIISAILDAEEGINRIGDAIRAISDAETKQRLGERYGTLLGILTFDLERTVLRSHPELAAGHPRGEGIS